MALGFGAGGARSSFGTPGALGLGLKMRWAFDARGGFGFVGTRGRDDEPAATTAAHERERRGAARCSHR